MRPRQGLCSPEAYAAAHGRPSPALLWASYDALRVLPHAMTDFLGPIGKFWNILPEGPVMTRRHPNGEWAEAFPRTSDDHGLLHFNSIGVELDAMFFISLF